MVASIGGVIGLTAGAAASAIADTSEVVAGFSLISAIGIGLYAAGELTDPAFETRVETTVEKHHRWARILTERAFRYAREGNCPRVRRVEKRVNVYDREFHDFVFMRDEEIAKCMSAAKDPPRATDDDSSGTDDSDRATDDGSGGADDGSRRATGPRDGEPADNASPPILAPPIIAPPAAPPTLPPPSSVRDPAEP